MSNQLWQITGPPGTGKTTYLARQAEAAVERHGADAVVVTSLTKAAAAEAAGRGTGAGFVGTMHSLCYRACGDGRAVLDSPKGLRTWNEYAATHDRDAWQVTTGTDPDDPLADGPADTLGAELLEGMNLLRHQLVPADHWPESITAFAALWRTCLADANAIDFTGMIEAGLELESAPGNPRVLVGDECQDWSRLEGLVFRRWASVADSAVMAGDPDQAIYEWRGGDPRIFLDHPVPAAQRRVLPQSYRVPRAVHAEAQRIIRQIPDRLDVEYRPRDEEGEVRTLETERWQIPDAWLDELESRTGSVMLLASCGYLLTPALKELRSQGVPFHNPYRRKQGAWNPLGSPDDRRLTAARQLRAYLGHDDARGWTADALRAWMPLLRSSDVLVRGAKKWLEDLSGHPDARRFFRDPADWDRAQARREDWLLDRVATKEAERLRFPMACWRRGGIAALETEPRIVVGTIHSVKGGEADNVAVITALPGRWAEEPDAPHLCRLFYVAATRARESLTWLCGDRGGFQP